MASTSWSANLKARRSSVVWRVLGDEGTFLASLLREPWLWLSMLLMALSGSVAYRVPYHFALDIGGSPKDCYADAVFDAPYLDGFNRGGSNDGVEFDGTPDDCSTRRVAYRWAFEEASIHIPGVGRSLHNVMLQVRIGQPSGMPVTSSVRINQSPTLALPIKPEPRIYHLIAPPSAADLDLAFHTPTYQPEGDPRSLAFAADRFSVAALGSTMPDWRQLATLSMVVGAGYILARRWSLTTRWAMATGVVVIAVLVLLLVWQRQGLTTFSGQALILLVWAYGLSVLIEGCASSIARLVGINVSRRETRVIVGLIMVAWLVRVLGLFHPQTFSSDVGLHINNLVGVTRGEIIFTEGLPSDAGGGDAPYPPAQYVMLLPLQLLFLEPMTLVTAGNALIDSLTIMWIWLALRNLHLPSATAIAAGSLYIFATPLLRSLSTGEMANVWGQALVMPWLLVLLIWRQRRVSGALLGLATAIVLLGHSGVFLSLVLLLGVLGMVWLVQRNPQVWRFAFATGIVLGVVVVGYYSAFFDIIRERPSPPPPTTSVLTRLGFEVGELLHWSGQIGPLLTLLGLTGLVLAWWRCRILGEVLLAWWLATLLSWGTLLFSQQALRWEAFILPAVVIGGGLVIAELWQRREMIRVGAVSLVGAALIHGGILWVQRLITYR